MDGVNMEGIATWFLHKSSPTFLALFCICGDSAARCSVLIPLCELYQSIAYRVEIVMEEEIHRITLLHCTMG